MENRFLSLMIDIMLQDAHHLVYQYIEDQNQLEAVEAVEEVVEAVEGAVEAVVEEEVVEEVECQAVVPY